MNVPVAAVQRKDQPVTPWCIVIVDDRPDDRAATRRMLPICSDMRLRFVEADTCAVAVRMVLGMAPPLECVVLNYSLPDINAPEVLAALTGEVGLTL